MLQLNLQIAARTDAVGVQTGLQDPFHGEAFIADEFEQPVCMSGADLVGERVEIQDRVNNGGLLRHGVDHNVNGGIGET